MPNNIKPVPRVTQAWPSDNLSWQNYILIFCQEKEVENHKQIQKHMAGACCQQYTLIMGHYGDPFSNKFLFVKK